MKPGDLLQRMHRGTGVVFSKENIPRSEIMGWLRELTGWAIVLEEPKKVGTRFHVHVLTEFGPGWVRPGDFKKVL
jgi:hypothetical protein